MTDQRISLYYEKLGEEHRVKGTFLKPPHVAKEDGYVGIQRRTGTTMWIPWERVIRWETEPPR